MSDPSDAHILAAARLLRDGGLVAFPTETVYGLGANALDPLAVAGIFELKGRPRFDPLIVHLDTADLLPTVADLTAIPTAIGGELIEQLVERFWPGPLTLVLPKADAVPGIVTSDLPTVAVRVPDHPIARRLIRAAGVPVAAPSANRFGRTSPTTAQHVADSFADQSPLILDGGPCRVGVESTVLSLIESRPRLLRPGGVAVEELEEITGPIERALPSSESENSPASSPGMLASHYAPQTPLRLSDEAAPHPDSDRRCGLLAWRPTTTAGEFAALELLSSSGDLREAAANLFAAIRRLDQAGLELIIATTPPPHGLGLAIQDRLSRAAAR